MIRRGSPAASSPVFEEDRLFDLRLEKPEKRISHERPRAPADAGSCRPPDRSLSNLSAHCCSNTFPRYQRPLLPHPVNGTPSPKRVASAGTSPYTHMSVNPVRRSGLSWFSNAITLVRVSKIPRSPEPSADPLCRVCACIRLCGRGPTPYARRFISLIRFTSGDYKVWISR